MSKKKEKDFSGLNMMINGISNKNKSVYQIEKSNEIEINRDEVLANYNFEFEVDDDTLEFLKEQTFKLHKASNKFYTELGKIFAETQEKLSQYGYGCFVEWYKSLGFKNDSVYRYINRYKLIFAQSEKQNIEKIESLPLSLSYEIAKDDCPAFIREKVIEREIKTVKELKEAIKETKNEVKHEEIKEVKEKEIIQEAEIVDEEVVEGVEPYVEKKVELDKFKIQLEVLMNEFSRVEKAIEERNTESNFEMLLRIQGLLNEIK